MSLVEACDPAGHVGESFASGVTPSMGATKNALIERSILTFVDSTAAALASCCHWQSQSLGQLQGRSPNPKEVFAEASSLDDAVFAS